MLSVERVPIKRMIDGKASLFFYTFTVDNVENVQTTKNKENPQFNDNICLHILKDNANMHSIRNAFGVLRYISLSLNEFRFCSIRYDFLYNDKFIPLHTESVLYEEVSTK